MITIEHWLTDHGDLDRLDRELLLCAALGLERARVVAHPELSLDEAELAQLQRWARRRRSGEPLAYILGHKEFWSLDLTVTPAVLIPRPETEILVEQALAVSSRGQRILDLGTGSGAIAIALASELDDAEIHASDISQAALKVAAANAATHRVTIHLLASDWFANITGDFHTIVSNPPYVAREDAHLGALHSEPREALVSGAEGLDAIRYIVPAARAHLAAGGWLVIEHGHEHAGDVRALMIRSGYRNVQSTRDLAGHERVSRGQWMGTP